LDAVPTCVPLADNPDGPDVDCILYKENEGVAVEADGTATPQWLFDLLDRLVEEITGHGFELDAAASHWNAKCAHYYDEKDDALKQDWSDFGTVWCNPPFSAELIGRFTAKASEAAEKGSTVVLLLPQWPGYDWYQEVKRRGEMRDVTGPVRFVHHDGGHVVLNNGRHSDSLVVALLGPHFAPGTNGPPIRSPGAAESPSETRRLHNGLPEPARSSKTRFVRLSELSPEATGWLWDRRIPKGELTVIDGDPSTSKSSLVMDITARVSQGREMPDRSQGTSGGVLLLLAEDSLRKTVLHRLDAAGADMRRIAVPSRPLLIPRDLGLIEEIACELKAALIVIDPIMAFLGVDANGDQKVRGALTPLKSFAETTGVAVVLVRHLTKRGGIHALYRGLGSIGIVAATRSALLVARSPDEPNLRVLCHSKSNLGPLAPSLLFEPVSTAEGVVRIEWRGECEYGPEDLLSPHHPNSSRLAEAMVFLTELLKQGPVPQQVVKVRTIQAGLAYRTVERAREILGVISERQGWGPGSTCHWRLPDDGA
jgi:phage N-6-adenine-methyltransferase